MWLIKDAVSYGKGGKVYAYAGEELKLISSFHNVLIVQNSLGEKFPIKKEFITTEKPIHENPDSRRTDKGKLHSMV